MEILLPVRPQPDTIVAIFLLKAFGRERFPGIGNARVSVTATPPQESFDDLVTKGVLPLDVGGGPLDHHGKGACTSELVADMLGVRNNPELAQLLMYAKRDDAEGKGTLSRDPIDRAFGLSGLIAALNKTYPGEAGKIVETVLPLLDAHYRASFDHHIALPKAVAEKKAKGEYEETRALQGGRELTIALVTSDKPAMVTYLRSRQGPQADVVVQKSEKSNRVCIVTRQQQEVNLSAVAALIRLKEAELRGITLPEESSYWSKDGKLSELPMWYVDPATNSILNVGNADSDTKIPWEEFKRLVAKGLEAVPPRRRQ